MAVIQISKIQLRRGKRNSDTGLPQLSSAEMAWAVDTQELYIGNGSLDEGAPFVGNTKILTEYDNILELAASYRFAESPESATIIRSQSRSLQSKLDEYVSLLDFGAIPDGSTGCADEFENALQDLFRNADDKFKKVLYVPNGIYLLERDVVVPSFAKIEGETRNGAVLLLGGNTIRFVTETGEEIQNFTSVNRPHDISISNITVEISSGQIDITGVRNSEFKEVLFQGDYVLGESVIDINLRSSGIYWQNNLIGLRTTEILFDECEFFKLSCAAKCEQTQTFPSVIDFRNCKFIENDISVYFSGIPSLDNDWKFRDCLFEEVATNIFLGTNSRGILFLDSQFKNCGNGVNLPSSPSSEMIDFGDSFNNRIINCISDRHQASAITSVATKISVPEVVSAAQVNFLDRQYADVVPSDSARPLMVFSAYNRCYYLNYILSMTGGYNRTGRLTVTIDDNLSNVAITDEYQYSPQFVLSPGGNLMTNFEFVAELRNNNIDVSGVDTLLLSYRNPLSFGTTGLLSYQFQYGV